MNTKPIKILTFGTGAIGSFYSACLASAGAEVTVVCRSDYIELTEKMPPYKTSMLLDFEAKRPMEVEAILGNALKFAEEKNIAVPYIRSFYGLLS